MLELYCSGWRVAVASGNVSAFPKATDWAYELKFDGYRALLLKDDPRVELRSRNNKDLTGM